MRFKHFCFLVLFLLLNPVNACAFRIYGEWACLGSFREKLSIKDYLIRSNKYDDFKQNGRKQYRKFLFFKNHRFIEDAADSEIDAHFRFDGKNVTIYLTKTYLFYDFEIAYHKGKKLIMYDKLDKLYYYFLKNKNGNAIKKLIK